MNINFNWTQTSKKRLLIYIIGLFILIMVIIILVDAYQKGKLFSGANDDGYGYGYGYKKVIADQQFDIKINEDFIIDGSNLIFKLIGIEDNRCPKGLICVWAGQVKAKFQVYRLDNQNSLGSITLSSVTNSNIDFDKYVIKISSVSPLKLDKVIDINDYIFSMTVSVMNQDLVLNKPIEFIVAKIQGKKNDLSRKIDLLIISDNNDVNEKHLNSIIINTDEKGKSIYPMSLVNICKITYYAKTDGYLSIKKNSCYSNEDKVEIGELVVGDFNSDDMINSLDFSILNQSWGKPNSKVDINNDGTVNSIDFSFINQNWGKKGDLLNDNIEI